MRISDWSSDVCSSDLSASRRQDPSGARRARGRERCGKVATIRHRQADAGDRRKNRRTQERTATRRGTMAATDPLRSGRSVATQIHDRTLDAPTSGSATVKNRLRNSTFAALLLWSLCAQAAVTAQLDREQMQPGESVQLNLERDGSGGAELDLSPLKKDFDVLGRSSGSSIQIINGSISRHKNEIGRASCRERVCQYV